MIFGFVAMPLMRLLGYAHGVEVGAKRYIDALTDERFETGHFYGIRIKSKGPLIDQAQFFTDLRNPAFQDNARAAVQRFM